MSWIANWDREVRTEKIFILGGRAGTSLVHKCLLITGLINWSTWSLHHYSSEPESFKHDFYNHYPNITEKMVRPAHPFEIAKCPDFGFIIDLLDRTYPNSKFIIMTRNVEDAVNSHINAWGNYIKMAWKNYKNWQRQLAFNIGSYHQETKSLLIGYTEWRERMEKESLAKISDRRKLYVDFYDLMNDWDSQMDKIGEYCDIPTKNYKGVWHELRKITLMHTATNVMEYL